MLYLKEYAKGVSKQSLKLTIHYFLKYMKYLMYRNLHFFKARHLLPQRLHFGKMLKMQRWTEKGRTLTSYAMY